MRYRPFGSTGLAVSELGFGCGSVGGLMVRGEPSDQREAVARALDAGITYFDTAQAYGEGRSEENLGHVLRELDAWGRVVVGTKLRLSRDDLGDATGAVRRLLRENLQRLGRDSIDLIQLHTRLVSSDAPDGLPANETAAIVADAMRTAVSDGLVRYIGLTGLGDTDAVLDVVRSGRFDTVQSYVNALNPSAAKAGASAGAQDFSGLINEAATQHMGVIAIRVLAAGAATGSVERAPNASPAGGGALAAGGEFDADVQRAQALASLARELGVESTLELSFRYVIAQEGVSTALVGFSNLAQLEEALVWQERGPLGAEAVARVEAEAK